MRDDFDYPTTWQTVKAMLCLLVFLFLLANIFIARVYPGYPNGVLGFWQEPKPWGVAADGGVP